MRSLKAGITVVGANDLQGALVVCPGVLLRVPRPAGSSLTSAEHPGRPLFKFLLYSPHKTPFAAMGVANLLQRSQGGGRRPEDMSGSRYAVPIADSKALNLAIAYKPLIRK